MPQLAFMTVGILHEPWGEPRVAGFQERTPATFAAALASEGFLRLIDPDETTAEAAEAVPWSMPDHQLRRADTLSVWRDLEAVFAFAYQGVHAEAISHRREWFVHGEWPAYVAWWVPDGHAPTWHEAYARYAQLHDIGPSPAAFDFKQAFDPQGQPVKIDRAVVKDNVARNSAPPAPAPAEPAAVVTDYIAAWSEPEPAARQRLLERAWAEHGAYTDRTVDLAGRAALDAHIGRFLAEQAGARFTLNQPPDFHHTHTRFFWTLHFANGFALPGMDYGEFGPDGRLVKIVGFF